MTYLLLTRILISLTVLTMAAQAHAQQTPPAASSLPGQVVISGSVPDESTKAALLAKLQDLYGSEKVIDQMVVDGVSTPPNWSQLIPKLVGPRLKAINKGQLTIEGTTVSLRGEVRTEEVRQDIANDFASTLNPGYVIKNGLRVTANTQTVIDSALANRIVEFEPGSAMLTDTGKNVLDEMLAVLKKLEGKKFEVIGHTDNIGAAHLNLALSRARAESVKNYLVAKGIRSEFISTSGMGEDQPMVSNDTEDGRRRNRRIEFRLSQ